MKQIGNITYIIIFSLLLYAIMIFSLLGMGRVTDAQFIRSEQRSRELFPQWEWKSNTMKEYFQKLENFINDNYAYRDNLTKWNNTMYYHLHVSVNPEKLLLGKNNYLFLGNYWQDVITETKGKDTLSGEYTQRFLKDMETRNRFLQMKGIPFYVVMAPNKHTVYPEYLPDYIHLSEHRFVEKLRAAEKQFTFLILEDTIKSLKKKYGDLLYNKTDSHWSAIGAFAAYCYLMNRIKKDFPLVTIFQFDTSKYQILDFPRGWGLGNMLNLKTSFDDYIVQLVNSKVNVDSIFLLSSDGKRKPVLWNKNVNAAEKMVIVNQMRPFTVLFLRDSYMEKMTPFLNQTFGKCIYYHFNSEEGREFVNLVDLYKPDMVVYEFVERLFGEGKHLLEEDILEFYNSGNYTRLCRFGADELFDKSYYFYGVMEKKVTGTGLMLLSKGKDPQFGLPPCLGISQAITVMLTVEVTVPEQTVLRVYYTLEGDNDFSQGQSIGKPVNKGRNIINIILPVKGMHIQKIRIDPGEVEGTYLIHKIEILAKNNNGPDAEGQTAAQVYN